MRNFYFEESDSLEEMLFKFFRDECSSDEEAWTRVADALKALYVFQRDRDKTGWEDGSIAA